MLNQTSAWWMHETQHIAPNALLAVPDPNVSIMRRCRVFPVEFVVRGYLTGMPRHKALGPSRGKKLHAQQRVLMQRVLQLPSASGRLPSVHVYSCVQICCSDCHVIRRPQAAQTRLCGRTMLRGRASTAATASRTACGRTTGAPVYIWPTWIFGQNACTRMARCRDCMHWVLLTERWPSTWGRAAALLQHVRLCSANAFRSLAEDSTSTVLPEQEGSKKVQHCH